MLEDLTGVPVPDPPDPLFEPYWEGTRNHQIVMPDCAACERTVWPPRDTCPTCRSDELTWGTRPTTGTLFSWTTVWKATAKGYTDVPYAVGLVELADDSARILGNVVNVDVHDLAIGMRLRARFVKAGADGDFTLVQWEPDGEPAPAQHSDNRGGES